MDFIELETAKCPPAAGFIYLSANIKHIEKYIFKIFLKNIAF